ncbi:hypothetical protein BC828DRAFT_388460 [Blastocladiella britannica]|nr:hypothetical protein BC828DRAFT_388460 [Blastocladiella britannica]
MDTDRHTIKGQGHGLPSCLPRSSPRNHQNMIQSPYYQLPIPLQRFPNASLLITSSWMTTLPPVHPNQCRQTTPLPLPRFLLRQQYLEQEQHQVQQRRPAFIEEPFTPPRPPAAASHVQDDDTASQTTLPLSTTTATTVKNKPGGRTIGLAQLRRIARMLETKPSAASSRATQKGKSKINNKKRRNNTNRPAL